MHLWKSHAIQIPLVKKHGFFFIDKGGVSVEPQGLYSIVCQSQEDTPIETANFEINKKIIEEIYNNLVKVLPEASAYKNNFAASACLKPSIISSTSKPLRNVGVEIHSLSKYAILALPGKATEAPYLADELVKIVFGYMSDSRIALRPGDDFIKNYGNN